jgi:ATP-dependent 26S proteasome regulatory subunit
MLQNLWFSFDQRGHECKHRAVLIINQLCALFVGVVQRGDIEVYDSVDVLKHRPVAVSSMQHHHDVELANVEEMNDRPDLVFGHIGGQDERLQREPV